MGLGQALPLGWLDLSCRGVCLVFSASPGRPGATSYGLHDQSMLVQCFARSPDAYLHLSIIPPRVVYTGPVRDGSYRQYHPTKHCAPAPRPACVAGPALWLRPGLRCISFLIIPPPASS
ncbi:hypothetical protein F5883DRAFT_543160 [Diaporthe sp. PMI_573]|nr:hypothetical protein F5883DRAFT_543160 [Diaporthaceae sp. PMI_573]